MGLLNQITEKTTVKQMDGTWICVETEKELKEAGTQYLGAYIDKRQATVAEWAALQSILEVFEKKTGYMGGGRFRRRGSGKPRPESS